MARQPVDVPSALLSVTAPIPSRNLVLQADSRAARDGRGLGLDHPREVSGCSAPLSMSKRSFKERLMHQLRPEPTHHRRYYPGIQPAVADSDSPQNESGNHRASSAST